MKHFSRNLIIFIIPIIIICLIIEICDRKIPNTYKYKYEWMQQNADNVETLVIYILPKSANF